jgi:hypothetical protein
MTSSVFAYNLSRVMNIVEIKLLDRRDRGLRHQLGRLRAMSVVGTFRKYRNVRLKSGMRTEADIRRQL